MSAFTSIQILRDEDFAQLSCLVGGAEDDDIHEVTRHVAAVALEDALSRHAITERRVVVVW